MRKLIVSFLVVFMINSCVKRKYVVVDGDQPYVYFEDYNKKIQFPYYTKLTPYPSNKRIDEFFGGKEIRKELQIDKISKKNFKGVLLLEESFIDGRVSFYESYKSDYSLEAYLHELKSNGFEGIEIIDSSSKHLKYLKVLDNDKYYVLEKSAVSDNTFFRHVILSKTQLNDGLTKVNFEKRILDENLEFILNEGSRDEEFILENGMSHFRNEYDFNYGLLNAALLDVDIKNIEVQDLEAFAVLNSFVSNDVVVSQIENRFIKIDSDVVKNLFSNSKEMSLSDALAVELGNHEMLILNESHHKASCRFQLKEMLPTLYSYGFRSIFYEGINKYNESINNQGIVDQEIGLYTSETNFGNLLKAAQSMGYEQFGYEIDPSMDKPLDGETRMQMRDRIQANNIITRIRKDKLLAKGKVIVYCGYGHANENGYPNWNTLAQLLKKNLQLDPLTINQTLNTTDFFEIYDNSSLLDNNSYLITSTFIRKKGYDYYLINKQSNANDKKGQNEVITKELINGVKNWSIIVIYDNNEFENIKRRAIPIMILNRSSELKSFGLDNGNFHIEIYDDNGNLKEFKKLSL